MGFSFLLRSGFVAWGVFGTLLLSHGAWAAQPAFVATDTLSMAYDGTFIANAVGDFRGDGTQTLIFGGPTWSNTGGWHWVDRPTPFVAVNVAATGKLADISTALFPDRPSAVHARYAATADFNGDGRPDFFSGNHGYDVSPWSGERQTLLVSGSAGQMENRSSTLPALDLFTHSSAVGDLRRNGRIDILVGIVGATPNDNVPSQYLGENIFFYQKNMVGAFLLRNDGNGNFSYDNTSLPAKLVLPYDTSGSSWTVPDLPGRFTSSLFADVNGDGYPDLIVGGDDYSKVAGAVYLNDRSGSFKTAEMLLPVGLFGAANTNTVHLASLDVNGDGCLDLLLSQTEKSPTYYGHQKVQVLINDCQGRFSDETASRMLGQTGEGGWAQFIRLADMNQDGWTDIVLQVESPAASQPIVWLNQGNGTFSPMSNSLLPSFPYGSLTPVDFDGDGVPDLVDVKTDPPSGMTVVRSYRNTATITDDSDRLFDWAEKRYPALFPSHATSQRTAGYYARCYNGQKVCVGVKEGRVYYYDGGQVMDLGPISSLLAGMD